MKTTGRFCEETVESDLGTSFTDVFCKYHFVLLDFNVFLLSLAVTMAVCVSVLACVHPY